MLSINTNIASLEAQNYLRTDENFQNQTINEVTSGLRIVNSGDDAAGLAIANSDGAENAVLTQGIQNANDGLSQLQIADGGMSNITQLLDRANTLATESASGAFTGDRGVLNSEFQSVIQEIDRQAQAIGLNQGGTFATNLQVFVGGGMASNGISSTSNGTVSVNLSNATVDAKSLGLAGVQATGVAGTDIGDGSTTSVQDILANTQNQASISNNTATFYFTGPGFSSTYGNNKLAVNVNLDGVTDANTLVTAINQAIQNAGNGSSQQATAFKNANITASVNTDSSGKEQLAFSSASTAFQVQGGDQMANAFLGNFESEAQGVTATPTATTETNYAAPTATETVNFRIVGAGLTGTQGEFNVALTIGESQTNAISAINTAIAGNSALAATGIQAQANGPTIQLVGPAGSSFQVQTAGDAENALGFGTWASSGGYSATGGPVVGNFDYHTLTANAVAPDAGGTQDVQISLNGGATIDLGNVTTAGGASAGAAETAAINALNTAFQSNAAVRAAGLTASDNGSGKIVISSSTNTNFRINLTSAAAQGNVFGFGDVSAAATSAATTGYSASEYGEGITSVDSSGAQQSVNSANSDVYQFTGLTNAGDQQTITLSAVDAAGNQHSLNIALNASNASTLDQALNTINSAIAASNDSTLGQIAAFKQVGQTPTGQEDADEVNGVEGVTFMSAGGQFKVSLGASPASATSGVAVGITDGGPSANGGGTDGGAVLTSAANGTGATLDISNVSTATNAVNALSAAVTQLGSAQAAVGRGENLFNYAINLANSQLTNVTAAESGIKDADMAAESANLTQASIQMQAGVAALAQANSAPQLVLSLLQK
ncbi:MAG TPA: flagellin [Bryobacteraceae bacterium]|nr:flagellin [Bryobacteraceae bacterium]